MSKVIYIVKGSWVQEPICEECGYEIQDNYCYEHGEYKFFCPKCFRKKHLQKDWIAMTCDCCEKVVDTFYDLGDEILCEDCCDEGYRREIVEAYARSD